MTRRVMKLECPRDRTPLAESRSSLLGVAVDQCATCHGVFLDDGEIARHAHQRSLAREVSLALGGKARSDLLCPACGGLMDALDVLTGDGRITIDACLTCHGIWLDGHETEPLRRAKSATVANAAGAGSVHPQVARSVASGKLERLREVERMLRWLR